MTINNSSNLCDVLIVGGGVAGVAAAYAAANQGARIVLIERYGFFGGLLGSAWVGTLCGIYKKNVQMLEFGVGKFPQSFAKKVLELENLVSPCTLPSGLSFIPASPISVDAVSRELLSHPNITLRPHSTVCGITNAGTSITSIQALCYNELQSFSAKSFIDVSGEAVLSRLAKHPTDPVETPQASSISIIVEKIGSKTDEQSLSKEIFFLVRREFPTISATILPSSLKDFSVVLKITRGKTPRSADEVIEEELSLRSIAEDVLRLLSSTLDEFRKAKIKELTVQIGIRASARPRGLYQLTEDEVISGKTFVDAVSLGCWPIEEWGVSGAVRMTDLMASNGRYQIPARSLTSEHADNLWFAGRSFSAEQRALGSARVVGTALGTGFAAGALAAFASQGKSLSDAIHFIQNDQEII